MVAELLVKIHMFLSFKITKLVYSLLQTLNSQEPVWFLNKKKIIICAQKTKQIVKGMAHVDLVNCQVSIS